MEPYVKVYVTTCIHITMFLFIVLYKCKHNFDAKCYYVRTRFSESGDTCDNCCPQFFKQRHILQIIKILCIMEQRLHCIIILC